MLAHSTLDSNHLSNIASLILLAFNLVSDGFQWRWATECLDNAVDGEAIRAKRQLAVRREDVDAALQLWHVRFQIYTRSVSNKTLPVEETICRDLLMLRFRTIQFWLMGCAEPSESVYDDCLPQFKTAIAGAQKTLISMERSGKIATFSFELGLIPPLYIIVTKCRHPVVRRNALRFLRRAPMQEGLWHRGIVLQVCERVIELEEGSDGFIDELPPDMVDMEIPESMRLKFIKIGGRTTHGDGRKGDFVDFFALPSGYDGDWCVTREFFAV